MAASGRKKYWIPAEVETINNHRYATLHSNDYKLNSYLELGSEVYKKHAGNHMGFMSHVLKLRNIAVDDMALKHVRAKIDPYAVKLDRKTRKSLRAEDLDEQVHINVEGCAFTLRTNLVETRCLQILLLPESLEGLRNYAQIFVNEGMGKPPTKRP